MSAASQLQRAQDFEQKGELAEAVVGYQKVLTREPSNTDALFLLGRAYCQVGRFSAGAELFQKIIKLKPNHAPAHTLLGRILAQRGDLSAALASYDRALAADPKNAMASANKADALDALGRHDEAVDAYDRALAIDPSNVATWCNRGSALQHLDRDAEAVESFKRALALRPNMAEVHFNLANALSALKRPSEAETHYRHAITLQPRFAEAYTNLATALSALARWDEVVECCEIVGRLRPDAKPYYTLGHALFQLERYEQSIPIFDKVLSLDPNHAQAMAKKARALHILGRLDEADKLIERAIELRPDCIDHYLLLAEFRQLKPGDPRADAAIERLQQLDTDNEGQETAVRFALAQIYGQTGQQEESLKCLIEANALVRQRLDFSVDAAIGTFERSREAFTAPLLRSKGGGGVPSEKPIFIVGMPRSGTTLTEQIIAAHPEVYGAGEIADFERILLSTRKFELGDFPDKMLTLTIDELSQIGSKYVARLSEMAPAANRVTNKDLGNSIYVGLIHLALPNARFLYVYRNPIDTCMSCFSLHFQAPLNYAYDLRELGLMYRAHERLSAHWRSVLPSEAWLEVEYEDLVEDFETQARRIIAHCGLEWDDACLAFHRAERPVRTASASQVRQPIYRSSIGRWQPFKGHLKPLFEALELDPDGA